MTRRTRSAGPRRRGRGQGLARDERGGRDPGDAQVPRDVLSLASDERERGRDARLRRRGTRGRFLGFGGDAKPRAWSFRVLSRSRVRAAVGGGGEPTVWLELPRASAAAPAPPPRTSRRCCRTAWRSAPRRSRARTQTSPSAGTTALAAKRGLAPSASARRDAADALFARSDLHPSAVMGANPEIAGDGTAESVAPLLTGYEGFPPLSRRSKTKMRSGEREGKARNVDLLAIRSRTTAAVSPGRSTRGSRTTSPRSSQSMDRTTPKRAGAGAPSRRASGGSTAARTDSKTNREKTNRESEKTQRTRAALGTEGSTNRSTTARSTNANVLTGSSLRAPWTARTFPWASVPTRGRRETAGGHARVLLAARARRRGRRRGGTTRRRARVRKRLRYRPGQATPSRVVISENEGARDKKSASEYPLGVKFATRDEATGNVAVTSAQMYRLGS